jgi:transcriptional regulator with XRE-family HTH domain
MAEDTDPGATWEQNFIKQMLRLREAHGMTQTDLARAAKALGLKFHQPTIQRIEAGERPVRLGEAHVIAGIFGVNLDVMTSPEPSSMELRLAATRMRQDSNAVLENLLTHLNEWLESVRYFEMVLCERIAESPDAPDDAALWGLAWVEKIPEAFGNFTYTLPWIARLGEPKSADLSNLSNDIDQVVKRLKALARKYEDQLRQPWLVGFRSLSELDSAFPGDKRRDAPRGFQLSGYQFESGLRREPDNGEG